MQLLDLPPELLAQIPQHLSCLQDHYNLIRTCRATNRCCASVKVPLPPAGNARSHSLLKTRRLLAGVARQIADWALQSENNRNVLEVSVRQGNTRLLELANRVTRLTLEDMRTLYSVNKRVVKSVALEIEDE